MRHILSTLIVSAASLCFLIPDPAYGQSTADEIIVTGSRITIRTNGDTAVSVVDPFQYRNEVVATIIEEINTITDALGPEYVAIIKGLDRQVYWDRQGDIELAFSLPYTYEIIPNTLHSKWEPED